MSVHLFLLFWLILSLFSPSSFPKWSRFYQSVKNSFRSRNLPQKTISKAFGAATSSSCNLYFIEDGKVERVRKGEAGEWMIFCIYIAFRSTLPRTYRWKQQIHWPHGIFVYDPPRRSEYASHLLTSERLCKDISMCFSIRFERIYKISNDGF